MMSPGCRSTSDDLQGRNQALRAALRNSHADFARRVLATRPNSFFAGIAAGLGFSICVRSFTPIVELLFAVMMNHFLIDHSTRDRKEKHSAVSRGRMIEVHREEWKVSTIARPSSTIYSAACWSDQRRQSKLDSKFGKLGSDGFTKW